MIGAKNWPEPAGPARIKTGRLELWRGEAHYWAGSRACGLRVRKCCGTVLQQGQRETHSQSACQRPRTRQRRPSVKPQSWMVLAPLPGKTAVGGLGSILPLGMHERSVCLSVLTEGCGRTGE